MTPVAETGKYVVRINIETDEYQFVDRVFAPPGGNWIDSDAAKMWAEQWIADQGGDNGGAITYKVVVLEPAV